MDLKTGLTVKRLFFSLTGWKERKKIHNSQQIIFLTRIQNLDFSYKVVSNLLFTSVMNLGGFLTLEMPVKELCSNS
jgi:hypothetical protein